jgi:lipopolysaccharide export system protein LptA
MVAANRRTNIVYEGDAVLWQGANRLRAERIEIDRNLRRLSAAGNVTSQLLEKANSQAAGDGEAPKYLLVQAAEMVYVEPASEAHYRENVRLRRGALEVAAHELRAHFSKSGEAQSGDDSEMALEWAAADGQVTIIERQGEHTRVGSGEHAEYYAREEKIVLNGGRPKLVDSIRGTTEGRRLTYFARNDRLLVEGAEAQPAVTRLRRN